MSIKNFVTCMTNYVLREEQYQGKTHIVAPVILMVEGVHTGSNGAVYYSAEELSRFASAWNGRPVPVFHPEQDGQYVSCNDPSIIERQSVGQIFNAHFADGKLRGEIWVDKEKASQVSPLALGHLLGGVAMDVSTGSFSEDEIVKGTWNGEEYTAVATAIRPDHLALLPGGEGACSWKDGCGVRANEDGGENVKRTKQPFTGPNKDDVEKVRELIAEGWIATMAKAGYREAMQEVQTHLNSMDTTTTYFYLEEMFDKFFVYRMDDPNGGKFFKQPYTFKDGVFNLEAAAEEVLRKVTYPALVANQKETDGGSKMKVDELITNEATAFTEEDREWLTALTDDQRVKLEPKPPEKKAKEPEKKEPEKKEAEEKETPAVFGKEEAIAVLKEQFKTKEQFLGLMPAEMADQFSSGLALHEEARGKLVAVIMTHSKVFTEEELKEKSTEDLKKIASLIPVKHDFSGLGNNSTDMGGKQEKMLPPHIVRKEEKGGK